MDSANPAYLVCLNLPCVVAFNGAYNLTQTIFEGIPTSANDRLTLPIPFYLGNPDQAALAHRVCSNVCAEKTMVVERAQDVGKRPHGLSNVAKQIFTSTAYPFLNAIYTTVATIWIITGGPHCGIYPKEEWAVNAMLRTPDADRRGFVVRGGTDAIFNAIKVYTSNGCENEVINAIEDKLWSGTVSFFQVESAVPAMDRVDKPLTVDEILMPSVSAAIAPIRGKDIEGCAETLGYLWELEGSKYPGSEPTPIPSPMSELSMQPDWTPVMPAKCPLHQEEFKSSPSPASKKGKSSVFASTSVNVGGTTLVLPANGPGPFTLLDFGRPEWWRETVTPGTFLKLRKHFDTLPMPRIVAILVHALFEEKHHLAVIALLQKAVATTTDMKVIHDKFQVLPTYMSRDVFDLAVRVYLLSLSWDEYAA